MIAAEVADVVVGLAALAVGIYLIGFWGPRRLRRSREAGRERAEVEDRRERERRQKESIEAFEVQMHEFSREMLARIDTKMAALKEHVARAEEVATRLEELSREVPAAPAVEPDPEPPARDTFNEAQAEVIRLKEAGKSLEEIAHETGRPIGEIELVFGLLARRADREAS